MKSKLYITILAVLTFSWTSLAATVPVRWLEGEKGYKQALELQKETHLPILVWVTWHECPNCAGVTAYLNTPKPKHTLQEYIRVIVDEHGKPSDAKFATEHKFSGGNFLIITPSSETPKESLWAWQPGEKHIILPDLDKTLAAQLATAKQ